MKEHFATHGGAVLGTAIRSYTFVQTAWYERKFYGTRFKFTYRTVESPDTIDEIKHPLIREAVRLVIPHDDVEMHTFGEVPSGTGLGSSSSFAVSLLQSFHAFKNALPSASVLTREAIKIEREILRERGGYQDQVFAAFGGFNLIEFGPGDNFSVCRLPLSAKRFEEVEKHCLLLYTNIRRNSFEVPLNTDVPPEKRTAILQLMAQQARDGAEYLLTGKPILGFGEILHEGWLLKQQVASVSLPIVDEIYSRARELGAVGGKILGAGRGGFLLLWASPEAQERILKEFGDSMHHMRVQVNAPGASIVYNW